MAETKEAEEGRGRKMGEGREERGLQERRKAGGGGRGRGREDKG